MLTRLREELRQGRFAHLVVHSVDRLARDPVHLGVVLSEAEHHGCTVHFVTEPLDTSPEGALVRFVRGYAARVEHEKIRERTYRGRLRRVEVGRPLPGRTPLYGYVWADAAKTRLEPHPVQAAVVRQIYEWAAAGWSLRQIAVELRRRGVPTAHGGQWWPSTLANLIRNPAYRGAYAGLRHSARGPVALAAVAPALVSGALWEQANRRVDLGRQLAARRNRTPDAALLRGLVWCGSCERPLYVVRRRTQQGERLLYVCTWDRALRAVAGPRTTIPVWRLDTAVLAQVRAVLTQPAVVQRMLAQALAQLQDRGAELGSYERRERQLVREQQNLVRALGQLGEDPAAQPVLERLRAVAAELSQLREEAREQAERLRQIQERRSWLEEQARWLTAAGQVFDALDRAEQRRLLVDLGCQVWVWPQGTREPRWAVTFDLPLTATTTTWRSGRYRIELPAVLG